MVLFVQKKIRDAWRQVTGKNICKTYVINKKGIELYDGFNQKKKRCIYTARKFKTKIEFFLSKKLSDCNLKIFGCL